MKTALICPSCDARLVVYNSAPGLTCKCVDCAQPFRTPTDAPDREDDIPQAVTPKAKLVTFLVLSIASLPVASLLGLLLGFIAVGVLDEKDQIVWAAAAPLASLVLFIVTAIVGLNSLSWAQAIGLFVGFAGLGFIAFGAPFRFLTFVVALPEVAVPLTASMGGIVGAVVAILWARSAGSGTTQLAAVAQANTFAQCGGIVLGVLGGLAGAAFSFAIAERDGPVRPGFITRPILGLLAGFSVFGLLGYVAGGFLGFIVGVFQDVRVEGLATSSTPIVKLDAVATLAQKIYVLINTPLQDE